MTNHFPTTCREVVDIDHQEGERMEQSMTAIEAARLIDWLKANGHSAEEATECIKYIATGIPSNNAEA